MKKNITIIILVLLVIILVGSFIFLRHKAQLNFQTYAECVEKTKVPCVFRFVGDFGQIWSPSSFDTKAKCDKANEGYGAYGCIIPLGEFSKERWIPAVDFDRSKREAENPIVNNSPVSTTLPQYISAQEGWPPVIQNSALAYSCAQSAGSGDVPTVVTQKTINGKTYCVSLVSDAAAGTIYKTYTYTTASGAGTKTTTFVLRFVECGNYRDNSTTGGTQYIQCQANQSSFNIDAIIASLM